MKLEKVVERINLMSEELDSMIRNQDMPIPFRVKAGRVHLDLMDDYNLCIEKEAPVKLLTEVMKEYEAVVMDLYKEI